MQSRQTKETPQVEVMNNIARLMAKTIELTKTAEPDFPAAMRIYIDVANLQRQHSDLEIDMPVPFFDLLLQSTHHNQLKETIQALNQFTWPDNQSTFHYIVDEVEKISPEDYQQFIDKLDSSDSKEMGLILQRNNEFDKLQALIEVMIQKQSSTTSRDALKLQAWLMDNSAKKQAHAYQLVMKRGSDCVDQNDNLAAMIFFVQALAKASTRYERFLAQYECLKVLRRTGNTAQFNDAIDYYTVTDEENQQRLLLTEEDLTYKLHQGKPLVEVEKTGMRQVFQSGYPLINKIMGLLNDLTGNDRSCFINLLTQKQLEVICVQSKIFTHRVYPRTDHRKLLMDVLSIKLNDLSKSKNADNKYYAIPALALMMCKINMETYTFGSHASLMYLANAISWNPYLNIDELFIEIANSSYDNVNELCVDILALSDGHLSALIEYAIRPYTAINDYFKDKKVKISAGIFSSTEVSALDYLRAELRKRQGSASELSAAGKSSLVVVSSVGPEARSASLAAAPAVLPDPEAQARLEASVAHYQQL